MNARISSVRLAVLVADGVSPFPFEKVVSEIVAGGADCIQLREKKLADSVLLQRAKLCRDLARDIIFIVNDRSEIALLSGADGVHVGRGDLPIAAAREILGPESIVGASAYNLQELLAAQAAGADYLGIGAVFHTGTKGAPVTGLPLVRAAAKYSKLPFLAIGGINHDNVLSVIDAGAKAVAVCSCILTSHDPRSATRRLKDTLLAAVP